MTTRCLVCVIALFSFACLAYSGETDPVTLTIAHNAGGLDIAKTMDVYVEGTQVSDIPSHRFQAGEKPVAATIHAENRMKMALRAGGAGYKFELLGSQDGKSMTQGQPIEGPPWMAVNGKLVDVSAKRDALVRGATFGPKIDAVVLNVCSMVPLAKTQKAIPGAIEKVEFPSGEELQFRPVTVEKDERQTIEALLSAAEPGLAGIRVKSPGDPGTVCVFEGFKDAGGLLFPMKWRLYSLIGTEKPLLVTTVTVTKAQVLHLPDSAYARESALTPIKPKEGEAK